MCVYVCICVCTCIDVCVCVCVEGGGVHMQPVNNDTYATGLFSVYRKLVISKVAGA